jgi:hypothetical protein
LKLVNSSRSVASDADITRGYEFLHSSSGTQELVTTKMDYDNI